MEGNGDESPPLQIDPKCIRDALRSFLPPIKNDDARLDFYTVYKKESTEYDVDYVKKYDEDLNTTLIFAGLFSAVSSAFVIDVQSKLETDPNEQSAALLRAILLTLNQSAIPGENPTAPPIKENTPHEIVTATGLMYASLLMSLLAAFVAMLGKQWLNRYLRHAGGSMIERCGDRQRKCDGLEKWPFHLFVESLPIMLQVSLLLLACGLCRYTWSINTTVAYILITLTTLGTLFYFAIVVAGTSSYDCPFQTPASTRLRSLWKGIRSHENLIIRPTAAIGPLWKHATRPIVVAIISFKHAFAGIILDLNRRVRVAFGPRPHTNNLSPVIALGEIREDSHVSLQPNPPFPSPSHGINSPTHDVDLSHHGSSSSLEILTNTMGIVEPWLTPENLTTIQNTNAKDIWCVSWILRNITDLEVLDAAIRFAGVVRWFENGINIEPPYSVIVSIFHTCFDSTGIVYPGLSERAYYYGRAMLWINVRALCVSKDLADNFRLPHGVEIEMPGHPNLSLLMMLCGEGSFDGLLSYMGQVTHTNNHAHMQWALYTILHRFWADQTRVVASGYIRYSDEIWSVPWKTIPSDVTLNLLLVWTISLGHPIEGEALTVQDKTVCLAQVINHLSRAIVAAIPTSSRLLRSMLAELTKWDNRPDYLRVAAHEWCSIISKNYGKLNCGEELIFYCLEISFRGVHLGYQWPGMQPAYTKHYPHVADIVSNSGGEETIADLLQGWITHGDSDSSPELLKPWAAHLVRLGRVAPTSRRLRRLTIHSILHISSQLISDPFELAGGPEGFVTLLDRLDIGIDDIPDMYERCVLLIPLTEVVRSPEGRRSLSYPSWELIPELAFSLVKNDTLDSTWLDMLRSPERRSPGSINYEVQVMVSLEEGREWDKLECWMGIVWFILLPKADSIPQDLERATLSLLRQRPGAAEKLEQRLQGLAVYVPECLESLRRICERAGLEAALRRDAT